MNPRIKEGVEFTTTQGLVEKLNLQILGINLQSRAIRMRKDLLAAMNSTDAKKGDDAYDLAHMEATIFLAAIKDNGSPYFSSIEEMQEKLIDTALKVLYGKYILHKQSNDGIIYSLDENEYMTVLDDIAEGGEEYVSPFWEAMEPRLQYNCMRTTTALYLNCLQEKYSGTTVQSDTESSIIQTG